MAVDNPNVVDVMGAETAAGRVVLSIADHLPWDDEHEHLVILQDKINAYISFVESGQIYEDYPKAAGKELRIDVYFLHPPSAAAVQFLERVREILRPIGLSLGWNCELNEETASL